VLNDLRRPILLVGAAFAALAIVVVGATAEPTPTAPEVILATASLPPDAPQEALRVEISGAVVTPGVYGLPPGARLIDGIEAAGGWGDRVDPLRVEICLNLAAPLVDGSAIRVPSRDDRFLLGTEGVSCGVLYASPTEISAADPSSGTAASSGKVDLNTATVEQLDSLPGIGPATAAKIIAARRTSPILIVDDLLSRGIISQRILDQIRALVTP
jgi:competence protein ComEA